MLIDTLESTGVTDSQLPSFLIDVALIVEAAGNVSRAARVGMLHPEGSDGLEALKWMIPVSRGGFDAHVDAEAAWMQVVAAAVKARGDESMPRLQREIEAMELTGRRWRGPVPEFEA